MPLALELDLLQRIKALNDAATYDLNTGDRVQSGGDLVLRLDSPATPSIRDR